MKTLKLNILQYFILIFCLSIFAISCSDDSTEEIQTNESIEKQTNSRVKELSNDENLIAVAKNLIEYNSFLYEIIEKQALSVNDLQDKLTDIQYNNIDADLQRKEIDRLFKAEVFDKSVSSSKEFSENWKVLTKRYGEIKQDELELALTDIFQNNKVFISLGGGDSCGWRYWLCMAGVAVVQVGCNALCDGATAGFGIYLCYIGCSLGVQPLKNECKKNYC